MKGQILDYSVQSNTGSITGSDGKRYYFSGTEWKGTSVPARGMSVGFETDGNQASDKRSRRAEVIGIGLLRRAAGS